MNGLDPSTIQPQTVLNNHTCLLVCENPPFEPQAEDILTDEDLLDLFRIIKQVLRKKPDSEKIGKLLFCVSYALGDHIKFIKPCHEDRIVFQDTHSVVHSVSLPNTSSCCQPSDLPIPKESTVQKWIDSTSASSLSPITHFTRLPSLSYLAHEDGIISSSDPFRPVRPPLNLSYTTSSTHSSPSPLVSTGLQPDDGGLGRLQPAKAEVVMEPQQRGFYYQDGRLTREPVLLQRYAEQGILTQASLMKKRKRQELDPIPVIPTKKPKIPHRHGEFESRRDDIINRMRAMTMADLEQKAQRLPPQFTLAIDKSVTSNEHILAMTVTGNQPNREQRIELLEPALLILSNHMNMKPHLDNGMNQNGIYYNSDYFRLYLAFEQFQRTFEILFPGETVKLGEDKDRERNANMKAYRPLIEPLLTETNWAAFRRNIVVGERMMQLTKTVGQGTLLMTKELSGSKLHLTFTNSEWDEFMDGLRSGRWDETIEWDEQQKLLEKPWLVSELKSKFKTDYWFHPEGHLVSAKDRRLLIHASTVSHNNSIRHRNTTSDSN